MCRVSQTFHYCFCAVPELMTSEPATDNDIRATLQQRERELAFANECLARFSYAISHEIHTPINTLKNLLEMFDAEQRSALDEESCELLDMILIGASRCTAISQGMQDYAGCSRDVHSEDIESVSCNDIVQIVVDSLAPQIEQSQGNIEISTLPNITTSPESLTQIFRHLIINALKFTDPNKARPQVRISALVCDERVQLTVADNGMGIGHDDEEHVFDLFTRLNARSKSDGAGLGLSQCQQLATALGGRLWVSSLAQGGSAFHLELPLKYKN